MYMIHASINRKSAVDITLTPLQWIRRVADYDHLRLITEEVIGYIETRR
jgi:hypothetical protein